MDIETIQKLIKKHAAEHDAFILRAKTADEYYRKQNAILFQKKNIEEDAENPLRNADNRIASNFFSLLVNQKAAYLFTAPPLFDIGSQKDNERVVGALGDGFAKCCKDLCIHASKDGIAWLHLWGNEEKIQYAPVPAVQVIPLWSTSLQKELIAVLRMYDDIVENGERYDIYEYWTADECYAYRKRCNFELSAMEDYNMFHSFDPNTGLVMDSNVRRHNFGSIPFIPFQNNGLQTGDLETIKELIDVYDKVYSGFMNDLEDIQEIVFVLSGYEGECLQEFLSNMKKYKTIKVDGIQESHAGLQTLTIDIPIEAREKMLSLTRKAIFEQGQGVDPDPQKFGEASGVALKYLYSLLELKAGLMETEFSLGFSTLIRTICRYLNIACRKINQTWTRTSITNDLELAEIAVKSAGILSRKTILKHHSWVENAELEERELDQERQQAEDRYNNFGNNFPKAAGKSGDSSVNRIGGDRKDEK